MYPHARTLAARRWLALTAAIACGTGSSARAPARASRTTSVAVSFSSEQGTSPPGQLVTIQLGDNATPACASIKYAGVGGWLDAGLVGSGALRSLSLQPRSHRLGPGSYRATVDVAAGGLVVPERVEILLTVFGPSHAICPPGSSLRYTGGGNGATEPADFGAKFLAKYCTVCHGSSVSGASRSGAPPGANWDTIATVRAQRYWIDALAGRGPGRSADAMPPGYVTVRPSQAERELLAQWIACGAP